MYLRLLCRCCWEYMRSSHCSSLAWNVTSSCSLPAGVFGYCLLGISVVYFRRMVPWINRRSHSLNPNSHTLSLLFHIIPRLYFSLKSDRRFPKSILIFTIFSIFSLCCSILRRTSIFSSVRSTSALPNALPFLDLCISYLNCSRSCINLYVHFVTQYNLDASCCTSSRSLSLDSATSCQLALSLLRSDGMALVALCKMIFC